MNRIVLLVSLILTLSCFTNQTKAQSFPLWGNLEPGAYAVGYRSSLMHDRSRTFIPERNYEGKLYTGERTRPLPVQIFYPAKSTPNVARMIYGDYLNIKGTNPLGISVMEEFRNRTSGIHDYYQGKYLQANRQGLYEKLVKMQTSAQWNAPAAKGRFPVIIYAGGAGFGTDESTVLWEYLASHGYIVAAIPTMGLDSVGFSADAVGLETLTRDMEFLLAQLREIPTADLSQVATMGFSYGGQAALLMAMRNPDIKAVIGLDPSFISPNYGKFLKNSPFYNADKVTFPVLEMHRKDEKTVTYEMTDAFKYSERYSFEINDLNHVDFTSLALIYNAVLPEQLKSNSPIVARKAAFEAMSRYILDFLDVYLKAETNKKERLKKPEKWQGYSPNDVSFRYLDALPAPPSYADLLQIIRERGFARGEQIYRELLKRDPNARVIGEQSTNELGYELMNDGKVDEAIRVLQLNVERFPRSANAYDSLADSYKKKGHQPCVMYAYRKVLEVLPQDTVLNESSKASLKQNAVEQLQKLQTINISGECELEVK